MCYLIHRDDVACARELQLGAQEMASSVDDDEGVDRETEQDLRQYGIYRALPVSGQPDFDSGPPNSAEEYLRRVR